MKRKGADQKRRLVEEAPVMIGVAVTRREWILLGAVLAAGIGLRVVAFSRSAVEHFDEGVYASNIYFVGPEYAYPQQRFYAPPLLPALIEAGMIVGLPPNVAALLPSFLAGCGTIVAVWWFGRSWFGPAVGLSAAMLVAFSDFHVAFSAAALTDALLGLWLMLAVDAIGRSLYNGDLRWAVGAGIYTGLAWWTKYNGWLPLAIEGVGLALLWLYLRPPPRQWMNWLGCFAVTCVVACAVWSPYFFSLQSHGGYGPIAANHAKYVVGLAGWLDSAARQISNQYVIEGLVSPFGLGLALTLPGFLRHQNVIDWIRRVGWLILIAAIALFWSSFVAIAVGAGIGLARSFVAFRQTPIGSAFLRHGIGLALVAAWWAGLAVATPIYAPYPRLVLPWIVAGWLGVALNCSEFSDELAWERFRVRPTRWQTAMQVAFAVSVLIVPWLFFPLDFDFEQTSDRRGLLRIAEEIHSVKAGGHPRVIYVFGEPALYFQLRAASEDIVAPVQEVPRQAATVNEKAVPTFLIVGPHSESDAQFQQQWVEAQERFELVERFEYAPSAMVWLDLHDPRKGAPDSGSHVVRLYRLKP